MLRVFADTAESCKSQPDVRKRLRGYNAALAHALLNNNAAEAKLCAAHIVRKYGLEVAIQTVEGAFMRRADRTPDFAIVRIKRTLEALYRMR